MHSGCNIIRRHPAAGSTAAADACGPCRGRAANMGFILLHPNWRSACDDDTWHAQTSVMLQNQDKSRTHAAAASEAAWRLRSMAAQMRAANWSSLSVTPPQVTPGSSASASSLHSGSPQPAVWHAAFRFQHFWASKIPLTRWRSGASGSFGHPDGSASPRMSEAQPVRSQHNAAPKGPGTGVAAA